MIMHTIALVLLILSAVDILIALETETRNITEGETFELKCSTNRQYPVVWQFRRSDGIHEIFLGGEISMAFKDMFRLTGDHSLGEYNLFIPSVDGRYAGNYKCIDNEGLGSELLSIQLNIIAMPSTTYMPPIAEHAPDSEDNEAPKAAASIFQNNMHSNSIANPGVVSAIVLSVIIVVAAIIIVAIVSILKWRSKSKKTYAEAQSPPRKKRSESSDSSIKCKEPVSFINPPLEKDKAAESDAETRDFLDPDFHPTGRRHVIVSQSSYSSGGSDSSKAELLPGGKERTPVT